MEHNELEHLQQKFVQLERGYDRHIIQLDKEQKAHAEFENTAANEEEFRTKYYQLMVQHNRLKTFLKDQKQLHEHIFSELNGTILEHRNKVSGLQRQVDELQSQLNRELPLRLEEEAREQLLKSAYSIIQLLENT